MQSADRPETRLATRLAFLIAGFGLACWAPLVPFAKARLGVDDGVLGILLLCLGLGSVAAMLATGMLSARYGSKPIIIAGGLGLALTLPILTIASTPFTLGVTLALFGAALGSLDVAMNIHAVEVEKGADRPLMSGFHALFSIGGFIGSLLVTLLLSVHAGPLVATLLSSALMLVALVVAWPRLLRTVPSEDAPLFAIPRSFVLLLAVLAAITFLVEGAILDWSALLLTTQGRVEASHGGLGYMLFAIAMTVGRLAGDTIMAKFGDRAIMLWGGLVAVSGFFVLLLSPIAILAMSGFLLIGLGASNIVPVLFRKGGTQTVMPAGLAVAAITMCGYAGVLIGPASVGFMANHIGLPGSFWILAILLCAAPLCAGIVTRTQSREETNAHRSYRPMDM
ncbi:MFS transporter [Rhizobium sp. ICMP 5592]|uniref:MFS transporter n=1 Tax=Rhizobium sp. ICMP 5592 TaxID=2292445 RepID=UPI001297ABF8|nr:MFS transporter [Rhizobium sp. ICMP 5592]MQB42389.1 MFS transporter [Rhizobium sp. ICMP 5592]